MNSNGKQEGSPWVRRFAIATLVAVLLVILWGAYVRATGSGAGCGSHWPLCNGELLPQSQNTETAIEFTHRVTSGISFLMVVGLILLVFRHFRPGHPVRYAAAASLFFMILEALLGAGLVLFGLVADDDSFARAWVMALHLINTYLLLASRALTAWWSTQKVVPDPNLHRRLALLLGLALLGSLVLGASGAVTALGDTLFPSESLEQALHEDFSPSAHFLIRLRIYHPIIAGIVALIVLGAALQAASYRSGYPTSALALTTGILMLVQLLAGALNLLLLAPIWMQLIHLLLADLVWISLVLLSVSALRERRLNLPSGRVPSPGQAG